MVIPLLTTGAAKVNLIKIPCSCFKIVINVIDQMQGNCITAAQCGGNTEILHSVHKLKHKTSKHSLDKIRYL